MSNELPSAQATEQAPEQQPNEGIQARINELVAKQRQAEEALKERDRQLMEQTAQMAQLAMQARQVAVQPPPAPVDPLAQFKDQLDPVAHAAIQAAVAETQRRMEAQYAPMFAQQAAQIAGFAVQAEAAALPGLPKEVTNRAAQLAAQWRSQGLQFPPSDAINFALGEYQRGQLMRAAPVAGYNPAVQPSPVIPGFTPQQAATTRALPPNFDNLTRQQQQAALEAAGVGDQPF